MTRRFFKWMMVIIVLAAAGVWVWHLTRPKPIEVSVKTVSRGTVERTVANTRAGTVKACRRAKLSPSIGGQIARLPIAEGDAVKKGDLLLELWNEDLAAQALLAEGQVTAARARARAVCLKADVAQRNADRLVALRRSDVVSEEQADNVVAVAAAARAECVAARTEGLVREAQLTVARANLARTRLTAPFDGVVAEIHGELFEVVTPSPVGIPTPPAVDLIDSTCFYISAPIDEVDAAGIRVGMPVRISLDAFGDRRFEGQVRRIADYVLDVEKQARTVDVEVSLDAPDDQKTLLAGYSADIEVILETRKDVVRAPTEAILEGRRVFVFDPATSRVAARAIGTGIANWQFTEVTTGLAPDDQVVVNVDHPDLADGAPAHLMEKTR
ncbi:MAG: efflux RND transporter periplasmic adaptor subunit [Pseudomonadota bacterium]